MFLGSGVDKIEANQITLGSTSPKIYYPDGVNNIIDSGITVDTTGGDYTMTGSFVTILNKQSGDTLVVPSLPSGFSQEYNSDSGILNITSSAKSVSDYQTVLRAVTLTSTGSYATDRNIMFVLGHLYPYFDASTSKTDPNYTSSGEVPHFYIRDTVVRNSRTATTTSYSYLGIQGYLVTLTSAAEETKVESLLTLNNDWTWLGGNDNWGGDGTDGQWRWVDGPEGALSQAISYSNWATGQPDNSGNQDYVRKLEEWSGTWDDHDDDGSQYNVIEYGGLSGDPRVAVNKTVNVESLPVVTTSAVNPIYVTGLGRSLYVDALVEVSGGNIAGATVTLVNVKSGDSLSVTNMNGITGSYNSGTGVLTLTGFNKTAAEYQAVLRTLVYQNSLASPDTTARVVRYAFTDTGRSYDRTITMQVPSVISKNGTTSEVFYFGTSSSFVVDNSLAVTGPSLSGAYAKIASGFVSGQDVLSVTNMHGLTGSYNSSTGLLTITGTGTAAQYQEMLRTVRYSNSAGTPTYGTRTIKYALGNVLPNFDNNHFYAQMVVSGTKPLWSESKIRALESSYLGQQGYLATITNSTEMAHISSTVALTTAWLGGSDENVEGTWRWVTGPEGLENGGLGRWFWSGVGSGSGGGSTLPDFYANWNGTAEPNNSGGAEDYLHLFSTGLWNDYPSTIRADYVVEYGGMSGDLVTIVSKNIVLSETAILATSVTTNTFVTSVGLTVAGASILVDRGISVTGATVSGGTVTIGSVKTGDVLSVTNQGGITGSYNSATGVLTLSGTATAANYQAILRTLVYQNTQNLPDMTTRTLTYALTYGTGGEQTTGSIQVSMQQPSTLSGTVSSQIYYSGEDEWMTVDGGLGLTGSNLSDFRFYVPSGANLNYSGGSLGASYGSGTLGFSGSGTAATYQSAIRSVQIKPNSVGSNFSIDLGVGHLRTPGSDTETFGYASVGSDATSAASMATSKTYYGWTGSVYSTNTGAKTVVVAYNTPGGGYGGPTVLTRSVSFQRYDAPGMVGHVTQNVMIVKPNLDSAPESIVLDEAISLTGGSSQESPLQGARVRIVGNFQSGEDVLSATASGGLSVSYASGTGILTVSGSGTVGTYQAVLRTVVYGNSANSPNTATRTMRFEIDYGGTNLTTKTVTSDVAVSFMVPNVMGKDSTTTLNYYVKSSAVTVDASVRVSGPSLSGAYVKIVSGFDAGKDVLSVTNVGSLSGSYNSGTGLLTITGTGTAAEYQTMLRSVTYANTSWSPSHTDRRIVYVLGSVLPDFNTMHFYGHRTNVVTWSQAKAIASGTGYLGYRGYVATVTTATENTHIGSLGILSDVWLGGSDAVSEGVWRWRTGPEGLENSGLGRQFWQGSQFGSATAPDSYAASAFGSGQPDNVGDQDYLQVTYGGSRLWDDTGVSSTRGFVVEYGGYAGEHGVSAVKTVEVRERPLIQMSTSSNVYVKANGAVLLDEQMVVAGYTISSATIQIDSGLDTGVDSMGATSQHGISVGYVTANGTLNLSGAGSSKSYQDVLRTAWYANSASSPTEGTRNMVYTLHFGDDPYFTTTAELSVGVSPVYTLTGSAVTVNYFSGRGSLTVPTALSVSGGTLSGALVKIVSNYQSTQDRLSATENYGISASFDISSGVLTLSGVGSAAEYEEVLSSVKYDNIAVSPSPLTKQVQFVLGPQLPATYNQHVYERYAYSTLPAVAQEWGSATRVHSYVTGSALSWEQARFLASTRAYMGWKGYLATVTSLSEAQGIGALLSGEAWLGGTDQASANSWRWVTGPEGLENSGAGRLFSNGGTAVGGYFTYWSSGQPSGGSGEAYLHMVYNPALGGQYQWTDLTMYGTSPVYLPKQYVSEYGGFAEDQTFWVQFPVKVFGSNHTIFFGTMF